ncbi:unnamed protein product, partial [Rotaria sp. Silwood1]
MRTFHDVPTSLVVEYICHYECINRQDLADRLCLNPKQIHSYIQQLKRDKYIKEEDRSKLKVGSRGKPNPNELYYKIDIDAFVNIVHYRLI